MIDKKLTFEKLTTLLNILQYDVDMINVMYGADILKDGKLVGKMVVTNEGIITGIHDELLEIDSFNYFIERGLDQKQDFVELKNNDFTMKYGLCGIDITTKKSDKKFMVFEPGYMIAYYTKDSNIPKVFYTEIEEDSEDISDLEDEVYEATGFDIIKSAVNIFKEKREIKKNKIVLTPNK
ncbi:MAG: hypothetical protein IKF36_05410 [Bacilli bacterium]|nr:hypothetical protein [Bacilli bacterium]